MICLACGDICWPDVGLRFIGVFRVGKDLSIEVEYRGVASELTAPCVCLCVIAGLRKKNFYSAFVENRHASSTFRNVLLHNNLFYNKTLPASKMYSLDNL